MNGTAEQGEMSGLSPEVLAERKAAADALAKRQADSTSQSADDIDAVWLPKNGLSLDRLFAVFLVLWYKIRKAMKEGQALSFDLLEIEWFEYTHVRRTTIAKIEASRGYVVDSAMRKRAQEGAPVGELNSGFASASRRAARITGLEKEPVVQKMLKRIEADNLQPKLRNDKKMLPWLFLQLADPMLGYDHKAVVRWAMSMFYAMVNRGKVESDPLTMQGCMESMASINWPADAIQSTVDFWTRAKQDVMNREAALPAIWQAALGTIERHGELQQIAILRTDDFQLGSYAIKNSKEFDVLIVARSDREIDGRARRNMVILTKAGANVYTRELGWVLHALEGDASFDDPNDEGEPGRWKAETRINAFFCGTLQRPVPPSYLTPESIAIIVRCCCFQEDTVFLNMNELEAFVDGLLNTVVPPRPWSTERRAEVRKELIGYLKYGVRTEHRD